MTRQRAKFIAKALSEYVSERIALERTVGTYPDKAYRERCIQTANEAYAHLIDVLANESGEYE